jgi:hypothetical protein
MRPLRIVFRTRIRGPYVARLIGDRGLYVSLERKLPHMMEALMTLIPEDADALLTRAALAEALTAAGFPVKAQTLATKASRGGGPPYQLFGVRPLYRWGPAVAWAESRLSAPRRSTSG